MRIPQLWLFAGPNGAGKSTFTQFPEWSRHIRHFLNADELTRELLRQNGFPSYSAAPPEILQRCNLTAAEKVFAEVRRLLDCGEAVAVETVLSTDKYRPVVEKLRREGGIFNLIYVGLRSLELSKQRVAIRVAKGGHPVPEEKLPGAGGVRWSICRGSPAGRITSSFSTIPTPIRTGNRRWWRAKARAPAVFVCSITRSIRHW